MPKTGPPENSIRSKSDRLNIPPRKFSFTVPKCPATQIFTISRDGETLTHLLKASLGTGILAMPVAFSYAGLVGGIISTILTAVVCTHCAYILVKCAHTLYRRTHKTAMGFSEVAEVAFTNGPAWGKPFAGIAKYSILYCLFLTYFGEFEPLTSFS
jgi:Transmembrane amino acid transporter protein